MSEEYTKDPIRADMDISDIIKRMSHLAPQLQIEWLNKIKRQVVSNLTAEATKREEEANKVKALLSDLKDD